MKKIFSFFKRLRVPESDNKQGLSESDNSTMIADCVVFAPIAGPGVGLMHDSNYNFYVLDIKSAEYFFDKYFTLLDNVNVNYMNFEKPWIRKAWKLEVNWLGLIGTTEREQMQIVNGLVCLHLPPASENISHTLQTWVAIDINENKVVSLGQWGYWRQDEVGLVNWLIELKKLTN